MVRGRLGIIVQSGHGEVFYRLPFNENLAWSKMMDYLAYRLLLQEESVSALSWEDMRKEGHVEGDYPLLETSSGCVSHLTKATKSL